MQEQKELVREINGGQELLINRTGIMMSPDLGAELVQGAKETIPSSEGNGENMESERAEYAQEGLPIGSNPAPVNGGERDKSEDLDAGPEQMAVLLDKLGERLAFERQGTRLYEAFIQKIEAMPLEDANAPTADDLRHICEEELEHFKLLQQAIVDLGGDATAQTPSADVAGVLSHGALQIMSDPRTTIAQALQAALTAELADNDGWEMLQELSVQLEQTDLAEQCGQAFEQEQEHLENIRSWLSSMTLSEALGETEMATTAAAGAEDDEEEDPSEKKPVRKKSRQTTKKKASSSKKKRKK